MRKYTHRNANIAFQKVNDTRHDTINIRHTIRTSKTRIRTLKTCNLKQKCQRSS